MLKDLSELLKKKSTFWFGIFFFINIIYALTRHSVDFYQFWLISRNAIFLKGYDIYAVNSDFSQPLFFWCIATVFSVFTYKTGLFLWNIMQMLLVTCIVILISRILGYGEGKDGGWDEEKHLKEGSYVIPLVLAAVIICDNLWLGQANILAFFFTVSAVYAHLKGKSWAAGILLALAVAVKLTPLLFLVYFIYKKDYAVLPWTLGGIVLFMFGFPSMLYGVPYTLMYLQDYLNLVIMPFFNNSVRIRGTTGFYHSNQSIDGFLGRHFTDFGIKEYGANGIGKLHNYLDPANLTLQQIKKIGLLVKAALVLMAAFAFTGSKKRAPQLLKFEFALVFLLILFISPASWLNHFVTVLFAYYVSLNYIRENNSSSTGKRILKAGLAACILLTAISSPGKYFQSFSGMFLGHFILMLALFLVLFIEKARIRKTWQAA